MKYTNYLKDSNPRVSIEVPNFGTMIVELFPEVAPISVENFLNLVDDKFYDGIIFHRVIKGFMIQGGDPKGIGVGGSDKKIKGEFAANGVKNDLEHTKGVISMARTMDPNSATSQFFLMHKDSPHLDGSYAAFGCVVEGLDVIDKIANVRTDFRDKPVEKVYMEEVKRVR